MSAQNSEARKRHESPSVVLPNSVLDALDILHELEWVHYSDGSIRCPDCRSHEANGHAIDCGLRHTLTIIDTEVLA